MPAETVEWAAAQIARFEGQAFLIPGNHDPMDPGSIYWRNDMEAIARRLTIVRQHRGELIEPEGLDLVLWGRAYLDSDWHFRPLEGLPGRVDGRWHIALAHGHFVPEGGESHRSLPIHEREIAAARGEWDYIALGHWEPHADVSRGGVTAVYSGAPMPLSDANRRAGLCAVVDFGPGACAGGRSGWTGRVRGSGEQRRAIQPARAIEAGLRDSMLYLRRRCRLICRCRSVGGN
ncbi:hypothetical protein O0235_00440 [Tepidiforma flava]|uniref:Calcineurin-like phosphoesterase domain-containing protein n=1 Tax=Tepidiforma flava TaxID=3004094 RepID=A0ABY7M6I7_9CHLR|nr:hypothetical protein [Tepidiforma flava]WBL36129.1 hypothetical protein O0235_00440 [Tepidiforma flava]